MKVEDMKFEEYVEQVKKEFGEISKLTKQEVDNYFSESGTIKTLEGAYRAYQRTGRIGEPISEASDLLMQY